METMQDLIDWIESHPVTAPELTDYPIGEWHINRINEMLDTIDYLPRRRMVGALLIQRFGPIKEIKTLTYPRVIDWLRWEPCAGCGEHSKKLNMGLGVCTPCLES